MNWERVRLGEAFEFQKKSKTKAGEGLDKGEYPFYTSSEILSKFLNEYHYEGDALIFGTGGKASVHYNGDKFSVSTDCFVIKPQNDDVFVKYVYYYLSGNIYLLEEGFKGAGLKHISKEYLSQIEIPLPPMSVQKEIVEKLDKAAAIREKSKALLAHYDALAESLFIELFGDPISNEKGWEVGVLDNVAPIKKYDKDIEPDNDGKFWLLNLDMIESNTGEIIDKNMVDISEINTSTIKFSEKNVLYSKLRPYLNKVVTPIEKGYCTTELLPLFPDENILDRNFLTYLLRSVSFVKYIEEKVAGAKMPRVNMDTLRRFNIILPPLSLQIKFAEMVENIEEQKARAKAEIEQSEAVFQALLQESFG